MIHHHIASKAKKHQTLLRLCAITLIAGIFAFSLNQYQTITEIDQQQHRLLDKSAHAILGQYHANGVGIIEHYFMMSLDYVEGLAKSSEIAARVGEKDWPSVEALLEDDFALIDQFAAVSLFTPDGVFRAGAGDTEFAKYYGVSFEYREYFQKALTNKKSYVGSVITDVGGELSVPVTVPRVTDGRVDYIITGFIRLSGLTHRLGVLVGGSEFADTHAQLIDEEGNLIYDQGREIAEGQNLIETNPVAAKLVTEKTNKSIAEVLDPAGGSALVRGERISIRESGVLSLISYFPNAQLEATKAQMDQELQKTFTGNALRGLFVILICGIAFAVVLRRHDARRSL